MKEKIKVHLADDHKILIEGIIAVINTEENILVEGYSLTGKEVTEWAQNSTADILILDIPVDDYTENGKVKKGKRSLIEEYKQMMKEC